MICTLQPRTNQTTQFISTVGNCRKPSIKPHYMDWGPDNEAEVQKDAMSQPRAFSPCILLCEMPFVRLFVQPPKHGVVEQCFFLLWRQG